MGYPEIIYMMIPALVDQCNPLDEKGRGGCNLPGDNVVFLTKTHIYQNQLYAI